MFRNLFYNFTQVLFLRVLLLLICRYNKRRELCNYFSVVSQKYTLCYLHAYFTPDSNSILDECSNLFSFSVLSRRYVLSNEISHSKVLSRQSPLQFLARSYLLNSFWSIYPIHIVYTELYEVLLPTSQIFILFFHHPAIHLQCKINGFWSVCIIFFNFISSLYSFRDSESSSTFQIIF